MEREIGYAMWRSMTRPRVPSSGSAACGRSMRTHGQKSTSRTTTLRASWNKGYGTEAVIAVLGHGLGPIGLDRIMAVAMPDNIGSWRVMEKAGMRYEGLVNYYGMDGLKKYRVPTSAEIVGRWFTTLLWFSVVVGLPEMRGRSVSSQAWPKLVSI